MVTFLLPAELDEDCDVVGGWLAVLASFVSERERFAGIDMRVEEGVGLFWSVSRGGVSSCGEGHF
jgi:hypothetical protein